MAVLSTIRCHVCGQTKEVIHSAGEGVPLVCRECKGKEVAAEKYAYLEALAQLPIKERLKKIEEQIYDWDPDEAPRSLRDKVYG